MTKTCACNKEGTKLFFSGPSFVPSFLSLCCFFPLLFFVVGGNGGVGRRSATALPCAAARGKPFLQLQRAGVCEAEGHRRLSPVSGPIRSCRCGRSFQTGFAAAGDRQTSVPCLLSLRPPREEYHGLAEFEINTSAVDVSKVSFSGVFWI